MNINRHNYEVFFIDYYDGNLTASQKKLLEMFLTENTDLREEFEQYETIQIPKQITSFPGKNQLKKKEIEEVAGIGEGNYEEMFIGFYEHDLEKEREEALLLFLEKNPQLQKEFELHRMAILKPADILFPAKETLRKRAAIAYHWYVTAAAAIVLLLFGLDFLLRMSNTEKQLDKTEIATLELKTYSGTLTNTLSDGPIVEKREEIPVVLPEPDPPVHEPVLMLASVGMQTVAVTPAPGRDLLAAGDHRSAPIAEPEKHESKSLLARVWRKNMSDITDNLGVELKSGKKKRKEKKEPGFVRFLDGSLTVFNTLTGSDTELLKNYDKKGHLKGYSLEGQAITFTRRLPPGRLSE